MPSCFPTKPSINSSPWRSESHMECLQTTFLILISTTSPHALANVDYTVLTLTLSIPTAIALFMLETLFPFIIFTNSNVILPSRSTSNAMMSGGLLILPTPTSPHDSLFKPYKSLFYLVCHLSNLACT